jgi:hypothetical protein
MSSPVNPNDLTRHQLDELDALLQRMLSLPMNGGPEPEPAPAMPSNWRTDTTPMARIPHVVTEVPMPQMAFTPSATTTPVWGMDPLARYTPSATPTSAPANFNVPLPPKLEVIPEATIPLFAPPSTTTVEPRTLRGVDSPANVLTAPQISLEPTRLTPTVVNVIPPAAYAHEPTIPTLAYPIFGLNYALETILSLAGPFGWLFTNKVSKQILGVCGLLLVVLATLWAARGLGWLDLPIPPEFAEKLRMGK